ncbi:adenylate/guanylate cyclase domain-containing protein [Variovorax sp. J22R133]|uniref:adenylate/guanylate cyclase domain-containing protein n=1 Tax=Variovorax brevis TaxID=3053503 RepID=UPI002577AB63|nr:adenylate/guanylate cyclase domain-containing protein [Variovorax sp. J22R133]MDM0116556.1 adenylate/guanylate cyclase domain-containing protein [Variovorax sp. J22R133]
MLAIPKTCAGCGGELQPGANFCQRCGRRAASLCPACGHACEPDFKFCPRCGAAQAPVQAEPVALQPQSVPSMPAMPPAANDNTDHHADRRQVTVLFADLTGFTSLAETLDPETLRAFQNALFATMAQAIAHYDGFVEKFVGDAVMAVFGAPRAHEDDPLRAVEAAQEMMQGVARLSQEWASRLGRAVTLHIGVHTGAVVAGSLGSGAGGTYAVTGDTVNTASRLLTAAEAGSVLVSGATHALVRHRFEFDAPADLALRGKALTMRVHRLVGERADVDSPRGLADLGLAAPLVGRTEAIDSLLDAFDGMQHGKAQWVSVVGEAGAGKSRLLAELFARLATDERFASTGVRRTTCTPLGEPTYGTFGALFREAYRVEAGDSLAVARRKLQEGLLALGAGTDEASAVSQVLNYLLGIQEGRPRDIEPEQLQRQITLAARALLERRLAQQPMLIVIDDLQWADAASVDLMREVADQLADRPLMVLAAQRPDARVPRPAHAQHRVIELGPLEDEDARALVNHLLGAPGDDRLQAVRDLVASRAGGNPLFVEEIVRSLADAGLLVRKNDGWACEAMNGAVDVPPTLYGLLLSRLDRLSPDDRRALQEAAVLGTGFDSTLLQRIASEPRSLHATLARLAAADLLRSDGPQGERWRFTHALLHEVAYQNLLLTRRTELHQRAGRALEDVLGIDAQTSLASDAAHPPQLAALEALGHHWSLSPDKARGARYLLAAGDWARSVYANDDAQRHYERTLRTLTEADDDTPEARVAQLDARERLGDLFGLRGQRAEALAHYECVKATVIDEAGGEPVRAARVLRKIGGLHWEAGERERASACFSAGLQQLGDDGDAIERAHLFQEMGRLAFRAGDNDTALSLAQRALSEVAAVPADASPRARNATVVRAEACNTLGVALARLGRPEEAVEQIEASVAQAEANDMLQAACRGYTNLGVLYATLDPQRSIDTCLRGLEAARKVGDLGFQSRLYANLAVAYCALTNRCEEEGIEAARAAASLDRRLGLLDHLAVPLIVLGQIYQCHGDAARAFTSYTEALQLAEQIDEPQLLFPCYDGLATLYLDAGRPAQAETYLAKAQAVCDRAGLQPDALMVLPFLC